MIEWHYNCLEIIFCIKHSDFNTPIPNFLLPADVNIFGYQVNFGAIIIHKVRRQFLYCLATNVKCLAKQGILMTSSVLECHIVFTFYFERRRCVPLLFCFEDQITVNIFNGNLRVDFTLDNIKILDN